MIWPTLALIRRARRGERAIAAVEMALMMPLLATLLLGSVDLTRYILLHQKAERIAFSIADIVAASESVTAGGMEDIMGAAAQIMEPFTFGPDGIVIVSSVYRDAAGNPQRTRWRYSGGGTLSRDSLVGAVNSSATIPSGLTLNVRENAIVTEVYYRFEPFFPGAELLINGDIYKTAVFKPRLGSLITPPT